MQGVARIRTWGFAAFTVNTSALTDMTTQAGGFRSNSYIYKVISVTYRNKVIKVIKVIKEIKGEFRKSKTQSTRKL